MTLTQELLERFVQLWQDPAATVAQIAAEFYITPREATLIAAQVRKELHALTPPVELLDKRRRKADYAALAAVAQEASDV